MKTTLSDPFLNQVCENLAVANQAHLARCPGEDGRRQAVHSVYGGAQLFKSNTSVRIGQLACTALTKYAPDAETLARALQLRSDLAETVYARVAAKLEREAVEDFRIDFEDGFGIRPDAEEDETALRCADEVAKGMAENTLPPFIGIRIKTFSEELKRRGIRTLDLFLTRLLAQTDGKLPDGFVVTLPKITSPAQVTALVDVFEHMEANTSLAAGALKMEFMVETPESIFADNGESALHGLLVAAKGRCTGAHFGTYDYTASMNIIAEHQAMDHSSCDFAKHMMKIALAGTGVHLSDGATNIMPVGPHRGTAETPLSVDQERENRDVVWRAWRLSYGHIRHSLVNGFYQGWDLHPAQLPVRYAALYAFFLEGLESSSIRLKNFIDQATKATLVGDVFDDAATGQGLLNFFLRALNCGAITEAEILATGLTREEIQSRSFVKILENRSGT